MKPIKMLGFAVMVALMAMAFGGTASAMAESTALCSVDEEECAEGNRILHVHLSTKTGIKVRLLSSSLNVECNLLFLAELLSIIPFVVSGNFSFSSCNNNCTVTEENGPAKLQFLKEGHETAKVTGEGLVHLNCAGFINCRYNGVGLKGTATGPLLSTEENGEISLQEQTVNKESGSLCPSTAKLDLTTTGLTKTYITH